MRTYIYVDGFNLYYRSLKNTPYRWLDLSALFSNVLQSHHDIQKIKYFTARVESREDDPKKPERQNTYLRALEAHCPNIERIEGFFQSNKKRLPLDGQVETKVRVLRTEEKGSDVNLAAHLLNDAWRDDYDCAVVVSNDSDLATAMRLVKQEANKVLGLLTPGVWKLPNNRSYNLRQHADFQRNIRRSHLKFSQLPDRTRTPKGNLYKPREW